MFKDQNITSQNRCDSSHFAGKFMFLLAGCAIGAVVALLFAPKRGEELRQDISDAAAKGYEDTIEALNRTKGYAADLAGSAKQKSEAMLDVVMAKASDVKDEIVDEAVEIRAKVKGAMNQVADSVRQSQNV
jgi:gas vesicle protein